MFIFSVSAIFSAISYSPRLFLLSLLFCCENDYIFNLIMVMAALINLQTNMCFILLFHYIVHFNYNLQLLLVLIFSLLFYGKINFMKITLIFMAEHNRTRSNDIGVSDLIRRPFCFLTYFQCQYFIQFLFMFKVIFNV